MELDTGISSNQKLHSKINSQWHEETKQLLGRFFENNTLEAAIYKHVRISTNTIKAPITQQKILTQSTQTNKRPKYLLPKIKEHKWPAGI